MALPYANSKADPLKAQMSIRKMLQKFGVDRIGFDEDFKNFTIVVYFTYNNFPISIPVNYKDLSEMYIKDDPWTHRRRCTQEEWEKDYAN